MPIKRSYTHFTGNQCLKIAAKKKKTKSYHIK